MITPGSPLWVAPFLALAIALLVDFLLGEPSPRLHPTVWMGKFIGAVEFRLKTGKPWVEKLEGTTLALSSIALFTSPVLFILPLAHNYLGFLAYTMIAAILLKSTFAIKSMEQHAAPIAEALGQGKVEEAKQLVSRIVRRDTASLSEEQVISAAVESVGESTVDGVTSPLFYFSLLGVPAAMAYRVINTLDSMVGYKNPKYINLGFLSAQLDTLANWIPARLTALLMVLAAWLLGENWRGALKILKRDRGKTESFNAGWPMSTIAGALRIQLEKPNFYILGDRETPPTAEHILRALRIMKLTSYLFVMLVVIPITSLTTTVIG